jgi:ligand-binding sensor domain-containing protein/anti-sigma regulatory factor (Ser/Thr protein kinase)
MVARHLYACVLLILALSALARPGGAESARSWDALRSTSFDVITRDQGLPHTIVMSVAEDRHGFIWMGTQGGLARYDGYRVKTIVGNLDDPQALPESFINDIYRDVRGDLWVVTNAGHVVRYLEDGDRFERFPIDGDGLGSMAQLAGDGTGRIWALGSNGLYRLTPATRQWDRIPLPVDPRKEGRPQRILIDAADTVWLGAASGLYTQAVGADGFSLVRGSEKRTISALGLGLDGRVVAGTSAGLLAVVDPAAEQPFHPLAQLPGTPTIRDIEEVEPGRFWIATFNAGIFTFDGASGALKQIQSDERQRRSLPSDNVYQFLRDRSGRLWAATGRGTAHTDPREGPFVSLLPGSSDRHGPVGTDASAILATAGGRFWVGYEKGRVELIDPTEGSVRRLPQGGENGLPAAAQIYQLHLSESGEGWIGTSQGLFRSTDSGQKIRRVSALEAAIVRTLMIEDDTLWVGTSDRGLIRLNTAGTIISSYRANPDDPASLTDSSVQTLLRDREVGLWVGTRRGLNLLDPAGGKVRRIIAAPGDPQGLPGDFISSLTFDSVGNLWVGTLGNGIAILDRARRGAMTFRRMGLAEGLPSLNVGAVISGPGRSIWASTADGLARIDHGAAGFTAFSAADGVAVRSYRTGSAAQASDGSIGFGGTGGVTIVLPNPTRDWAFQPPVMMTALHIDSRSLPGSSSIVLQPGDRSLQVEFTALDYSAPERNRYTYRLDGYDPQWIATDSDRRLAAYTRLPPGSYRLLLRGSNRNGIWTEPATAIPVTVLPAWYQTTPFQLAVALVAIGLILAAIHLRTTLLRHRQRELEAEVQMRTRQIADQAQTLTEQRNALSDTLTALQSAQTRLVQQEKLASLGQMVAGIAHEMNTPLGVAITSASLLSGHLAETVTSADQKQLTRNSLQQFFAVAGSSLTMVNGSLDKAANLVRMFKQLVVERRDADIQPVNIRALVQDALTACSTLPGFSGIVLNRQIPPDLTLTSCPDLLQGVLTHLIQNAVQHGLTTQGTPTLIFAAERRDDGKIQLQITDNGSGMTEPVRRQALDPFFTTARGQGRTGLGLNIVHNLVTGPLQGEVDLISTAGQGTTVTLILPELIGG